MVNADVSSIRENNLSNKESVFTAIFKMDNQQGATVQHRELCSMLWGSPDVRGV